MIRRLAVCFSLALLLGAQIPLASFNGTVHGVSKKQVTIETAGENLVDFEINRKTRVLRAKKPISVEQLQSGDLVTIEAREEMGKFLIAVIIIVREKPKE
jgi:hypothetical protein